MIPAHLNRYTAAIRWILFIICLSFPLNAEVQQPETQQQVQPVAESSVAEVRVDGHVLFRVRGIVGYPAQRRAKEIAQRIVEVAKSGNIAPESVRLGPLSSDRIEIFAAKTWLVTANKADAELEGIDLELYAYAVSQRIKEGIIEYRKDRSSSALERNIYYAALMTLLFLVIFYGLILLFRWFDRLAEQGLKKQIKSLEEKSLKLVRARKVWGVLRTVLTTLRWLLIVFAAYIYFNMMLKLLPETREISNQLFAYIIDPLKQIGSGIVSYIPSLIFLVIIVVIVRYLLHTIHTLFSAIHYGSVRFENFESEWAWPTYKIVRLVVVIFALVIAYPYIPGSNSGAFKSIGLFLGVVVSLGSTSAIANIIAGYFIMYRRAFHIGDLVKIGDTLGYVTEMRQVVTHLRTPKNEEVVLPNSMIMNGTVVNYSSLAEESGLVLHTTVGIGYEVPWRQVEAMLVMAAERTEGLLVEPKPFVLQKSLGDFAVTYELNVYSQDATNMPQKYSELHQNILDVFNEYGIQIMTPNYRSDPAEPKLVPKERWFDAPAASPRNDDMKHNDEPTG